MTAQHDYEQTFINRNCYGPEGQKALSEALSCPSIQVNDATLLDIELLENGTYAPLTRFATREEWAGIVNEMRLPSGQLWPIPMTLPVSEAEALTLCDGQEVWLRTSDGRCHATLHINDVFPCDKLREAECVYRTVDENHPGVKLLYEREEYCVSGSITVVQSPTSGVLPIIASPSQAHAVIRTRGWQTVVGMLIHDRCDEQLKQSVAACVAQPVDGVLVQVVCDVVGTDAITSTCQSIEQWLQANQLFNVVVMPYPAASRHAGARERLMQALIQRNYGCTHFVVGGAACGNNWSDVQLMFRQIEVSSLGIQPIFG